MPSVVESSLQSGSQSDLGRSPGIAGARPSNNASGPPMTSSTSSAVPHVTLYHVPPSFYSQVARLVLAEADVRYTGRYAIAGPPSYETYEPWYLELNPGGTVPTLVIGDEVFDDSRKILHAVDAQLASGRLTPDDEDHRATMNHWLDKAYALPERILAYGSGRIRGVGARVNRGRHGALQERKERHPDLAAVYDAKLADIDSFMAEAADDTLVERLHDERSRVLDELDQRVAEDPFIVGEAYTLADVMWTATVSRQIMLGDKPLTGRPHVAEWYHRMKERPSFARAGVWERPRPLEMLPVVYDKFPVVIYGALAAIAVAGAVVYALFATG